MREILFRGKRLDNGEWVYGYFVKKCDVDVGLSDFYIVDMFEFSQSSDYCGRIVDCVHSVIPETVGQYTGLTDKNGKKIFEGDIVNCISSDIVGNPKHSKIIVEDMFDYNTMVYLNISDELEVIGNIHDCKAEDFLK